MKCRIANGVIALLFAASVANAETLPLETAISKARSNHPSIMVMAHDHKIAGDAVELRKVAKLPRVDSSLGYTMQLEPQAVKMNGNTIETQEGSYLFGNVAAQYTIYDFGRRNSSIKQAELGQELTAELIEARKSDIALQVIEIYFSILETEKLILSAEREKLQLEDHRRVAQALYDNGVVTKNDLLQADARIASINQKILAYNNRKVNLWLALNHATGDNQGYRAELVESATVLTDGIDGDKAALFTGNRHEIKALVKAEAIAEQTADESKASFYPEIFARAAVDYMQNDKVREQSILSATIGIKFNIFDGFGSTNAKRKALSDLSKAKESLKKNESEINLEIAVAKNDMATAKNQITVAESSIVQCRENLRINQERYKERIGTATEVVDAQTLLTQAETDLYRAKYELQRSGARFKKAVGLL